jgi:hypothetical protein
MRTHIVLTVVLASLLFSGCGLGLLYTHTVKPLGANMRSTEMVKTSGQGDIKRIAIQGISVTWGDSALGDIAKEKGLTELYYADRETLFVMFGIWHQETIHLYGR